MGFALRADDSREIARTFRAIREKGSSVASSTVENYIKHIYLQLQETPDRLLPTGRLAAVMQVVPGTATAMVKTLADSGLVEYEPRGGLRLTPCGEQLALRVLRRHRIVELYLTEVLGLDWSEVHEEAETLEHVVSDKVLERMDQMLGHPRFDPHGDPIPSAKGRVRRTSLQALADMTEGDSARIARVSDQDPGFLQFLDREGLMPGTLVTLIRRDPHADSLTIKREGYGEATLGGGAALKIFVDTKLRAERRSSPALPV